ncbi:MAG TPA: CbtA family protein [Nitrosopumilaceae archaeon]|nr:CbtA family protein [Nitrosopumilaceae archaeon]
MKTRHFIGIVLLAGCFAGIIHGATNLAIVEPYLDEAIGIENQNLFASGEEKNTPEFWVEYSAYRDWQKGGQVLAGAILGTSIGALFGIVFAYSRKILPGKHNVQKGLVLAGIMWTTIYFIPFLKYPANPPTVGDTETVVLRAVLYLTFTAISGFSVIGFYKLSKKFQGRKKLVAVIGYAIFMGTMFIVMPPNPDEIIAPMELVNGFRIMSIIAVSVFWLALGIILGLFWQKIQPDRPIQTQTY